MYIKVLSLRPSKVFQKAYFMCLLKDKIETVMVDIDLGMGLCLGNEGYASQLAMTWQWW